MPIFTAGWLVVGSRARAEEVYSEREADHGMDYAMRDSKTDSTERLHNHKCQQIVCVY